MAKKTNAFEGLEGKLRHDCNRALCRFLQGFDCRSVSAGGVRWIRFTHPTLRREGYPDWRWRFFLPAQPAKPARPWFPCSEAMREFYQFFDGLREQSPGHSGDFISLAEVKKVGDYYEQEDFPEFMAFQDQPIIFFAASGDSLIQTKGETFVWLQLETHEMPQCANSFAGLIDAWVAHHSVGDGHPFDSWGRD